MSNFEENNGRLKIVEPSESSEVKEEELSASAMSGDRPQKRSGRRPGRRSAKMDVRAKLERSRQSARECRARKKLRYQYLEDLVANREKAVFALRSELEMYKTWCSQLDKGLMPLMLLKITEEIDKADSKPIVTDSTSKGNDETGMISDDIVVDEEINRTQDEHNNDAEAQLSKSLFLAGVTPSEAKMAGQAHNEAEVVSQVQNEAEMASLSQNEAKMASQSQSEAKMNGKCHNEAARSDNLDHCPRFDNDSKYLFTASKSDIFVKFADEDHYVGLNSVAGSSHEDHSWVYIYDDEEEEDYMTVVPAKNNFRTLKSNLLTIVEEEDES